MKKTIGKKSSLITSKKVLPPGLSRVLPIIAISLFFSQFLLIPALAESVEYYEGYNIISHDDGTREIITGALNYLRWDGVWRPNSELNISNGNWPYLYTENEMTGDFKVDDNTLSIPKANTQFKLTQNSISYNLVYSKSELMGKEKSINLTDAFIDFPYNLKSKKPKKEYRDEFNIKYDRFNFKAGMEHIVIHDDTPRDYIEDGKVYQDVTYLFPDDYDFKIDNYGQIRLKFKKKSLDKLNGNIIFEIRSWDVVGANNSMWGGNVTFDNITEVRSTGNAELRQKVEDYVLYTRFDEGNGTIIHNENTSNVLTGNLEGGIDNDSINQSSVSINSVPGKVNGSIRFDGNIYIDLGKNDSLQPDNNELTLEAWVNLNNTVGFRSVIGNKVGNYGYSLNYNRNKASGSPPDNNRWNFVIPVGGNYYNVASNVDINTGVWKHIVGVYNGSYISIYVNGILENSAPVTGNMQNSANPREVLIGADPDGTASKLEGFFQGDIDEVRIYKRAMNATEVNWSYALGSQGMRSNVSGTNLIGAWSLDEYTGNIVYDETNANNGTFYGGKIYSHGKYTPGKYGQAFHFNGFDNKVLFNNHQALQLPYNFTISLYMKQDPGVHNPDSDILRKGSTATATSWYKVELTNDLIHGSMTINGSVYNLDDIQTRLDGLWHFMVYTRELNWCSLIIDGITVRSTTTCSTGSVSNNGDLSIGSKDTYNQTTGLDFTNATIDDVRIYDRNLSSLEIANIQNNSHYTAGSITRNLTSAIGPGEELKALGCNGTWDRSITKVDILASMDNDIWVTIQSNSTPNVVYSVDSGNNYTYSRCSLSTTNISQTPIIESIRSKIGSIASIPEIIYYSPFSPVNNIEGETRTFSQTLDMMADVIWYINGTQVFNQTGVSVSSYINTSASIGIWNVSAIAANSNGSVIQTWIWNVTPLPGSPSIIGFAPPSPVNDSQGSSRTFNITVNQTVNVTWYINGTRVFNQTGISVSSYTNTSASFGIWNVSAIANNTYGIVMQTWIWNATGTGPITIAFVADARPGEAYRTGHYVLRDHFNQIIPKSPNGKVDAVVMIGDMNPINFDSYNTVAEYAASTASSIPSFFVVGNHELDNALDLPEIKQRFASYSYSPRPGPAGTRNTTYSFDVGDIHVIVLNEYWDGGSDPTCAWYMPAGFSSPGVGDGCYKYSTTDGGYIPDELYNWIENDLNSNTKKWTVVAGHEPLYVRYDSGADSLNENETNRNKLENLFISKNVTAFIGADTHESDLTMIDNIFHANAGVIGDFADNIFKNSGHDNFATIIYATINESGYFIIEKVSENMTWSTPSSISLVRSPVIENQTQLSSISFTDPTPTNNSILAQNNITINTTMLNSSSTTAFIDWNSSLVGWWRLNNESTEGNNLFRDWSSYENNGICSGTTCPHYTSGKFGNAVWFDGNNDVINAGNNASLNLTGNITIEAWVRPERELDAASDIVKKASTDVTDGYELSLDPYGKAFFRINQKTSGDTYKLMSSSSYPVDGYTWVHLVGIYNGTELQIYFNGYLENSMSGPSGIFSNNDNLLMGGTDNDFRGSMDEVRIWNRALRQEEIKASYDAGINRLYRNFTYLAYGTYNYKTYIQNFYGIVNQTETRIVTLVSVGAPAINGSSPPSPVNDSEGATRTFNITVNQKVNVTWLINGSQVSSNSSATEANYTNTSAKAGIWNVSAIVNNTNGSTMQTWIWNVTALPPGSPNITSFEPPSPVNDTERSTRTFNLSLNQTVNVTWFINGTQAGFNENVTEGNYTNSSSAIGIWNITAVANNNNGTATLEWIWNVTTLPPGSPNITSFAPLSPVNDTERSTRAFNLSLNQTVNVTWFINGTQDGFNENVTEGNYINSSSAIGIWNVSAVANNNNGSTMQTWIWNVTALPPGSPNITSFAPLSPVNDTEGATRTFNLSLNQTVNVTWFINGTQAGFNENVTEGNYTNSSSAIGIWNITAVANNNNRTATLEWIWIVTTLPPGSPNITSFEPPSPVNDTERSTRTFNLSLNQSVNVTWFINGTQAGFNENVTEGNYTNSSSAIGIWNITAVANNNNGSAMQTWIWNVTAIPPGSPNITSYAPLSPANNTVEATRTFNITVNQTVNVTWYINGTEVFNQTDVIESAYTNTSASAGLWSVSAIANNSNGITMQTWIWDVSSTILSPVISFIYPTPGDGETLAQNYAYINTSILNSTNTTAFIDWNRSLAGWWRFNGESGESSTFFREWSGYGNNGICSGIRCPTSAAGKFGNGLKFDGLNDYVNTGNGANLNLTRNITVEAWVKPERSGTSYIVKKASSGSTDGYELSLSGAGKAFFRVNQKTWGDTYKITSSSSYPINGNAWVHLVGIYNGSQLQIYFNGNLENIMPGPASILPNNDNLELGGPDGSYYFKGTIDEVRIWNRALSPEEIKASYDAGTYRLYRNFTDLAEPIYSYEAYAQKSTGNVSRTEIRTLNIAPIVGIQPTIPPIPIFASNTTGPFWVNYSWSAGTGNITNSYNVSINGNWTNGTTSLYSNKTVGPHGISSIIVYAYNNSGSLSESSLTDSITLPDHPVTITNTSNANVNARDIVYVDYDSNDLDLDVPTFSCNRTDLFTDFNTLTGKGNWTTSIPGIYFVNFGVSDGFGSFDNYTMTINVTASSQPFIPPNPISLSNITGLFWINYSWSAGTGNITDSYDVNINGTWTYGTNSPYSNKTVGPHGTSTIVVNAYNNSGSLSVGSLTDSIMLPNHPVTLTNTSNANVNIRDIVYVDYDSNDLDLDVPTFSNNRTDLFTDFNTLTGKGNWTASTPGIYFVNFGVSDGFGSFDNYTMIINVSDVPDFIFFTDPTPANNTIIYNNYAYINTTISEPINTTAFINWNSSLVGWWRFNNESGESSTFFRDWSGYGNNGICSGIRCPTSAAGKFGNGLKFDGLNDYVNTGNGANLNLTRNITVEAWVKPERSGTSYIVKKASSGSTDGYELSLSGAGKAFFRVNQKTSGDTYKITSSSSYPINGNAWVHLVGIYNGSQLQIYFNGNLENIIPGPASILPNNDNLELGGPDGSYYFKGTIDEVRIWNRALSPEEIKASYDAGTYRLYRNFNNLLGGTYIYRAYAQNVSGRIDQTEMRTLYINTS